MDVTITNPPAWQVSITNMAPPLALTVINPPVWHVSVADEGMHITLTSSGVQGPAGATGPAGGDILTASFSYGDATPALLTTVAANKRIYSVQIYIETAFNGTGAALSVGWTGAQEDLLAITDNLPGSLGLYETTPDRKYGSSTQIFLYITPGSGASLGAGQVRIEIEA